VQGKHPSTDWVCCATYYVYCSSEKCEYAKEVWSGWDDSLATLVTATQSIGEEENTQRDRVWKMKDP
jgi:hypothetical protein